MNLKITACLKCGQLKYSAARNADGVCNDCKVGKPPPKGKA